jgi:hypothetical protein
VSNSAILRSPFKTIEPPEDTGSLPPEYRRVGLNFQVFPSGIFPEFNKKAAGCRNCILPSTEMRPKGGFSATPGGGRVPERAAGFGVGLRAAQAQIVQRPEVQHFQRATLAADGEKPSDRCPECKAGQSGGAGSGDKGHDLCPFRDVRCFLGIVSIFLICMAQCVSFAKRMFVRPAIKDCDQCEIST